MDNDDLLLIIGYISFPICSYKHGFKRTQIHYFILLEVRSLKSSHWTKIKH